MVVPKPQGWGAQTAGSAPQALASTGLPEAAHVRAVGVRGIPETERRSGALPAPSLPPPAPSPGEARATSSFSRI